MGTVHADRLLPSPTDETLPLPAPPLINPSLYATGDYFLARVAGESVQLAGLLNNDWLLCHLDIPEQGDIVVAKIANNLYVKIFSQRFDVVVLESTALGYEAIITRGSDIEIIGIVEHVLRYRISKRKPAKKDCPNCLFRPTCNKNE
jgi:Peptidase S24-like